MISDQAEYDLRCEWGLAGLEALAPASDAVIIVDVLRFSTAVDIAVARGAAVLPYRWRDPSAQAYAAAKGASLASLSPVAMRSVAAGAAVLLPSPNGSTLAMSTASAPVFTACLRNCRAVAAHVCRHGSHIAVIPAGERWSDGSLRPAIEDLIGAGAVLAAFPGRLSPEAEAAVAAFERFRHNLHDALARSTSGKELIARGLGEDVALAAEYAVSEAVPVMREDRFVNATARSL